ncbi:MAG: fructose-6-phosphate aldolase [Methanoregula sp.]
MKIFLDSADISEIRRYNHLIDGVTTNPTLVAKSCNGLKYSEWLDTIVHLVNGPISIEVISQNYEDMVAEAQKIAELSENIVVKIPMTEDGLKATRILAQKNIKTNVTLIFSVNQSLLAAKAGATYVSIFVGRLDDLGHNGMDIVKDTVSILEKYQYSTNVIAASIRHPLHVIEAAKAGTHVATIPPAILSRMNYHPLTTSGLEQFLHDWNQLSSEKKI